VALNILFVALGGAIGSILRYLTATYSSKFFGTNFPYGTLIVNVAGAFIVMFFMTLYIEKFSMDPIWRLFIVVGFLGGLTTFSSFSYETITFFQTGEYWKGLSNILLNNVLTIVAGIAGLYLARTMVV
jgi:CrcB protein